MTLQEHFQNVFTYSRGIENWCKKAYNANQDQYEFQYTFISDFAIADWHSESAVKDTYNQFIKEYSDDYEALTELIISLNMLSWANAKLCDQGIEDREKFVELYADLYYEAKDTFYDNFADDKEAKQYMFNLTD